jgi:hypothetical protein
VRRNGCRNALSGPLWTDTAESAQGFHSTGTETRFTDGRRGHTRRAQHISVAKRNVVQPDIERSWAQMSPGFCRPTGTLAERDSISEFPFR